MEDRPGNEGKICIVLNKSGMVDCQQPMRVRDRFSLVYRNVLGPSSSLRYQQVSEYKEWRPAQRILEHFIYLVFR
ncbi:hypothetical protein ANCCEY_08929 [Ancylostoma ceylanicum]|uniref:Uncharacterized protein n=1 Tax=Ancylostoma ceylanicum TaxID=53326 RepID=A0A0D6LLC3_9BILA|nr:hypothetical protein ANCCEY_08929 [Ancylostoma ceylanicum]